MSRRSTASTFLDPSAGRMTRFSIERSSRTLLERFLGTAWWHFAVAQAGVGTLQGIGGTVSATLAGATVVFAGYHTAFLTLALIAGSGGLLFWLFMPETRPDRLPDVLGTGATMLAPSAPDRKPKRIAEFGGLAPS